MNETMAASAPASAPLSFPPLDILPARRLTAYVDFPKSSADELCMTSPSLKRRDSIAGNVLVRENADGSFAKKAYWIQRKVSKIACGSVRAGYLLRPMSSSESSSSTNLWEVIPTASSPTANTAASDNGSRNYEMVTIKLFDRRKLSVLSDRTADSPLTELRVAQIISDMDPEAHHVLGCIELLSDERWIYCVMPYIGDGNLLEYIGICGRLNDGAARYYFRQILEGLMLFQKAGICDRGLTLERVLLRGSNSFLSGSSTCVRVPYMSADGQSSATDISNGTTRRLITPQGQCGSQNYIPPEILSNEESFDGHAVHTWAAGVMLFVMLFGRQPFVWATIEDPRYRMIAVDGKLSELVNKMIEKEEKETGIGEQTHTEQHLDISEKAIDLLQKMLREDPKERLTLSEIMEHDWMVGGEVEMPPLPPRMPKNMRICEDES